MVNSADWSDKEQNSVSSLHGFRIYYELSADMSLRHQDYSRPQAILKVRPVNSPDSKVHYVY